MDWVGIRDMESYHLYNQLVTERSPQAGFLMKENRDIGHGSKYISAFFLPSEITPTTDNISDKYIHYALERGG